MNTLLSVVAHLPARETGDLISWVSSALSEGWRFPWEVVCHPRTSSLLRIQFPSRTLKLLVTIDLTFFLKS